MTVGEFIKFLKTKPENMPVCYRKYSEQCLLQAVEIEEEELCLPRGDGWVQNKRPDMPTQKYLVLPGN